ncbi:UNVERIFIED_CONTAM: hypothetical protein Sindi_0411900 [Sesamum indicum]
MARTAVGFVGLDEVSLKLAASLLQSGYAVQAFEASGQLLDDFSKQGGKRCTNLMESGQGVNALVILVSHVDQINDLFFADKGVLRGLLRLAKWRFFITCDSLRLKCTNVSSPAP